MTRDCYYLNLQKQKIEYVYTGEKRLPADSETEKLISSRLIKYKENHIKLKGYPCFNEPIYSFIAFYSNHDQVIINLGKTDFYESVAIHNKESSFSIFHETKGKIKTHPTYTSSIVQTKDKKYIFGVSSWSEKVVPFGGIITIIDQKFNNQIVPQNQLKELNEELGINEKQILTHELIGIDRHGWVGFIFFTALNLNSNEVKNIFEKNTHPDKNEHKDLIILNDNNLNNIQCDEVTKIKINLYLRSRFNRL